ncbi:MAG: hypothetical protein CVV64_07640 [Candidatus Wallbacteria bacterium HGW-Wallbacteria-1]|jgi:hypothetical protein|uniref:Poly(3-hydroxyalkanoate) polymerase subunit PhaE n=1 Tax=Candidatus Wallbacteria bacterium HGW-Wallbacteria-1 TaxID=2013854 RepID=A0A2N1PR50_9BACT|nr:MAG: hypothetical protein CVV64_07640 [Candidatus Wallbacteria bacterium HGW-Wallbacteria-1]
MFGFNDEMMKNMYQNWEKAVSENLEKMVRDQGFISEMAKAMASSMSGQASAKKMMDETLVSMNLPTRGELVKALQKLTDIEERVIDLSETLEDLRDMVQGMSAISDSGREDVIVDKINSIEKRLDEGFKKLGGTASVAPRRGKKKED